MIQLRCPALQSILFDGFRSECPPDVFINFMQNCRWLRSIKISQNMSRTGARCILPFLATRDIEQTCRICEGLEELVICDLALVRSKELQSSALRYSDWGRADHFLRFVQQCTSLKKLMLGSTADLLVSEEVFAYLAGLHSISVIMIYRLLDQAFIRSVLQLMSGRPLFHGVRDVTLCVEAQAFALLAPSLVSITRLSLRIDDPNNEICGLVGQLPCLTQLILKFVATKEFSRNELTSLVKLQGLHDLRLEPSQDIRDSHLAVPWMRDSDFENWICSFPHLKVLCLDWSLGDTLLTAKATAGLAHKCPDLISIAVIWHHDLDVWMASPPLFRNLKSISFKCTSLSSNINE